MHRLDLHQGIYLLHNFLDDPQCQAEIARGEAVGFGDAPVTTARGMVMRKDIRNNDRAMLDDQTAALALWERLRPHAPPEIGPWRPVGLNERLRYYRYTPGQRFAPHRDGHFAREDGERSFWTFMVYLDEGCEGGQTRFFGDPVGWGTSPEIFVDVRPTRGSALLFRHEWLHEGAEVTRGVKHVLRSDVMFRQGA